MECGWLSCLSKAPNRRSQFRATGEIHRFHTSPSPSHQELHGGCGIANFPGESPIVALSTIPSGVSGSNRSAEQRKGRNRARQELREAPGHRERFGLCTAAALRGARCPELLLFNVFPPDRKWGTEPTPKSCILSVMEKYS